MKKKETGWKDWLNNYSREEYLRKLEFNALCEEAASVSRVIDMLSFGLMGTFTIDMINIYLLCLIFIIALMSTHVEVLSLLRALRYINKYLYKYATIAPIYRYYKKAEDYKACILLWLYVLFFYLCEKQHILYFSNISSALIILLFLVFVRDKLISYRIRKGLFATNRTEARELIDFIIKNSDNLDFTDSNGNLRRALLPEAADAAEERIPGTLGEGALA